MKKRKLTALLLIFAMAAALIGLIPAQRAEAAVKEFSDVTHDTVNNTSYNSIYWAADQGIVSGYSDGSFKPENICTREQFTIMLWRFNGMPASDAGAVNKFTDVSSFSNNTSKKAVAWAVDQKIVAGFSDGSFKPKDDITRAQVAVMLWRFAGQPATDTSSSKFNDISPYSTNVQKAIIWAEKSGIASGYGDGTFKPDDGCQRQHMAIFLCRYAAKIQGRTIVVPDVDKGGSGEDPESPEDPEKKTWSLLIEEKNYETGRTVNYKYDSQGRLKEVTCSKPSGKSTVTYSSDGKSAEIKGSYRMCARVEQKYYDDGTIKTETGYNDSGKKVMEVEYNSSGYETVNRYYDDDGKLDIVQLTTYDSRGDQIHVISKDADGNVLFEGYNETEYDAKGNMIKYSAFDGMHNLEFYTEYAYNADGDCTEMKEYTYSSELEKIVFEGKTTYKYSKGRTTEFIEYGADGSVSRRGVFEYDTKGRDLKDTYYAGDSVESYTEYKYEGDKLTETTYDGAGTPLIHEIYQYMEKEPAEYPLTYHFFEE